MSRHIRIIVKLLLFTFLAGSIATASPAVTVTADTPGFPNIIASIPLDSPRGIGTNPTTNRIYAGTRKDIAVIDGTTNQILTTITGPSNVGFAYEVEVNHVTNKIYVGYYTSATVGAVSVIDGATNSITTRSTGSIYELQVNTTANRIYYTERTSSGYTVVVADGNGQPLSSIPLTGAIVEGDLRINESTSRIYHAKEGSIAVYDTNLSLLSPITLSQGEVPYRLALIPQANRLYAGVDYQGQVRVVVIDMTTHLVVQRVDIPVNIGFGTFYLIANPATNHIFIDVADHLYLLDGSTNTVTADGGLNGSADGLAVNLQTNRVYRTTATSIGSDVVHVIQDEEGTPPGLITVTTVVDELNNNGNCALREAIRAANLNVSVDACPAGSSSATDTIDLPPGTYTLSIAGSGEDAAATGDLDITDNLTIFGGNADTRIIDGGRLDRVFHVIGAVSVDISAVTIRNGQTQSSQHGAGIYNAGGALSLHNSTVRDNQGQGYGGGVANSSDGDLSVAGSLISNNTANFGGGGIYNLGRVHLINASVEGNKGDSQGGGIHNSGGTITLYYSTVISNTSFFGGGIFNRDAGGTSLINSAVVNNVAADGGGGGIVSQSGSLNLYNSTVSGNTVGGPGGGILATANSTVTLNNVTITNNMATDKFYLGDGGGISSGNSTINLSNTILAGNKDSGNNAPDCSGTVTSQGYNLIQSTASCTIIGDTTGNKLSMNPGLRPLQISSTQFPNGTTLIHPTLSNSPAINAGNPSIPGSTDTSCRNDDQRGVSRPDGHPDWGVRCDIGAYERELATPDSDGDGLPNEWELHGYNGLDLPAMGADPNHKDIFIEIDYMKEAGFICSNIISCRVGHDHKPDQEAIDMVVEAFKNAPVSNPDNINGINLHVDLGSESTMKFVRGSPVKWGALSRSDALPHDDYTVTDNPGNEFPQIKSKYFESSRKGIFHYTIFVHESEAAGTAEIPDDSILAGTPGDDLLVAFPNFAQNSKPAIWQAGVFMHELGHNLGLRHGGSDDIKFKPNYLSVMNYAFTETGFWYGGEEGEIDYSRTELPPLQETDLDESKGLGGDPSSETYGTRWACPGEDSNSVPITGFEIFANRPTNWNCNTNSQGKPHIESHVRANINGNRDANGNGIFTDTLQGHFDWDKLVYDGGDIGKTTSQYQSLNRVFTSATAQRDEPPIDLDAQLPSPYRVRVTEPGNIVAIVGTTVEISFSVVNLGLNFDIYTLSGSSSRAWADLGSVPSNISVAPGQSRTITIRSTVPLGATGGVANELKLIARSQGSPRIFDVASSTTTVARNIYLPLIRK
jgi:CSLREA domain-containing protein